MFWTKVLAKLIGNNELLAKQASVKALTTPLATKDIGLLNGTTALQMLCSSEQGLTALLALLQTNPDLVNTLYPSLSERYQHSNDKSNATAEAQHLVDQAFVKETAWQALCATSRGREVLQFILSHSHLAVKSAKYAIPMRQIVDDITHSTDEPSTVARHYQNAIKVNAFMCLYSIQSDYPFDQILLNAQTQIGSDNATELLNFQRFAHLTIHCAQAISTVQNPVLQPYRNLFLETLITPQAVFKLLGEELKYDTKDKSPNVFNTISLLARKIQKDSKTCMDLAHKEILTNLFQAIAKGLNAYTSQKASILHDRKMEHN